MLFLPVATVKECKDKNSWMNTGYEYPEDAYRSFYSSLGECIAAWASVENNLFGICAYSLKSEEHKAVSAMFYETPGFRAKLDMTSAVVRNVKNTKQDLKKWDELYKKMAKKSSMRNRVAHGTIFYAHTEKKENRRFYLSSPSMSSPEDQKLYESDLNSIRDSFVALAKQVFDYYRSLPDVK